ncbi:hypothetical protein GCM10011506_32590 [Marivirga lumbricoides]|uniref:ABC transmembrane type-1 domain-containing protein n=1 Tax=Marivirga lumbricoides TaxID=1046115 RepID=A0ABQ1MPK1_9BACT|nr:hypothetical protein GCM10011506_32590 [Marivirga lumbricoides]
MSNLWSFLVENKQEILKQLLEHIELTFISLFFAAVFGISIGMFIASKRKFAQSFIGLVNVIQTVPSIALLGFLLPLFGIGIVPAIIALFLYALLPIVRNTYTGLVEVEPAVKEAAVAMGMTKKQILLKVELPLSLPYIMAGIRTASVINVGVATLSAFIAAGGLGKFILQGIQLNNTQMILAGAIPASLLALSMDAILGIIQRSSINVIKWVMIGFTGVLLMYFGGRAVNNIDFDKNNDDERLLGGFPSEFIYREDGLKGLFAHYDFKIDYVEMEIGLMYKALAEKQVDIVSGFSTDGRIKSYNLKVLDDDQNYFPPYQAAPMARREALRQYPQLQSALERLADKIDNRAMMEMNYQVDEGKQSPKDVAYEFLKSNNLLAESSNENSRRGVIKIGSKAFTENYILAHIFQLMIESHTNLSVEMNLGFGGTKLLMDAMKNNEIDLYPEYTGTALMLLLDTKSSQVQQLLSNPEEVFDFVNKESTEQFGFSWLPPLGFNNTFAMLMRQEQAERLGLESMSDLAGEVR